MRLLTWALIATGILIVAACAVRVHRRRDPVAPGGLTLRLAVPLLAAAVLPLPALLAGKTSAVAWDLWGATTIAAAVTWAVADTLRDIADRSGPGTGRTS